MTRPSTSYRGITSFLDAHGIAHPAPAPDGFAPNLDTFAGFRDAIQQLEGFEVASRPEPAVESLEETPEEVPDDYSWPGMHFDFYGRRSDRLGALASLCFPLSEGGRGALRFTAGDLRAQLAITERIARVFGSHILQPHHLSEIPILVQAGDDPVRLLAEWERRTAELGR